MVLGMYARRFMGCVCLPGALRRRSARAIALRGSPRSLGVSRAHRTDCANCEPDRLFSPKRTDLKPYGISYFFRVSKALFFVVGTPSSQGRLPCVFPVDRREVRKNAFPFGESPSDRSFSAKIQGLAYKSGICPTVGSSARLRKRTVPKGLTRRRVVSKGATRRVN